jgi:hypothetical protein
MTERQEIKQLKRMARAASRAHREAKRMVREAKRLEKQEHDAKIDRFCQKHLGCTYDSLRGRRMWRTS